jgi:hypothetical protein
MKKNRVNNHIMDDIDLNLDLNIMNYENEEIDESVICNE